MTPASGRALALRAKRAIGLVIKPRRARAQLEIAADARRFRRSHPFLRAPGPRSGQTALAVSLSGWPYQLKLEGMLLKALELTGFRPLILTGRELRRAAGRYHDAFGAEAIEIERFAQQGPASALRREADALLEGALTVERLKELHYGDVNVGQHVLSTVSRQLFDGSVGLEDPVAQALVRRLMPQAMELALVAERLLDELQPDVVLFNEARYAGYGPIFEAALARDLNVIQFVHGYSDDALVFKRYSAGSSRVHPRSLSDASWAEVEAAPWTVEMEAELSAQFDVRYGAVDLLSRRLHERTRRRPREELVDALCLDPRKPSAVVFSHVLWDANLFYGDDLFQDQEEWLIETIREAAANPALNWIVKLHPANVWKRQLEGQTGELPELESIRGVLGALPPHVRLLLPDTDVSTLSLFELADYAVTIRGTVGVEAPCFGVPVITGGTSHYSGRGFTVDSDSVGSYRALLAHLQDVPPLSPEQVLLAKKHAHGLFCRRPTHFTSFRSRIEPGGRPGRPLDHDLELMVRSAAELRSAPDLQAFAAWAGDRAQEDYLAPLVQLAAVRS